MALDKAIYVPLFTETSVAIDSPFFHVFPGDIALIQAFGFMDYKERADKTELQVPQVACLEMLLSRKASSLHARPTPALSWICDSTRRIFSPKRRCA